MPNFNSVVLMGNVTRDPELTYIDNADVPVCNFSLAINHVYTDKSSEKHKDVCFIDCELFSKSAEIFNKYVHKGDPVHIAGRLKFNTWQGKNGDSHRKITVHVNNFQFLKSKEEDPNDR